MGFRVLAVGDVCGQPGLDMLERRLKDLKKERNINIIIVICPKIDTIFFAKNFYPFDHFFFF